MSELRRISPIRMGRTALALPIRAVRRFDRWRYAKRAEQTELQLLRTAQTFLARQPRPLKFHFGCGQIRYDGWINVDLSSEKADLRWDLTTPFPLEDSCSSFIYSEHVLEHFSIQDGLKLLRESYRLLRPGGVIRIAMPGIDYYVNAYLKNDWRDPEWVALPEVAAIKTRAEMLNAIMRFWGHQHLYDAEELFRRLYEAGFQDMKLVEHSKSEHSELCGLESRVLSTLICEAVAR